MARCEEQLHVNQIEKIVIDSGLPENGEAKSIVDNYIEECNKGLDDVIGFINVDLDGRESQVLFFLI